MLQKDIFETIRILQSKGIQLEAADEASFCAFWESTSDDRGPVHDAWGVPSSGWGGRRNESKSCIGFYASDWDNISSLYDIGEPPTWSLYRNAFTIMKGNCCLAGTIIYKAEEILESLKKIQKICKEKNPSKSQRLALIVAPKEFSKKLKETFKRLEKKQREEYVEFFENIRVLPLPELVKTPEIKDASEFKKTQKIPVLSKKIRKLDQGEKRMFVQISGKRNIKSQKMNIWSFVVNKNNSKMIKYAVSFK